MLGEALTVGSSLVWAVAVIYFRRSSAADPRSMNLFKNTLGSALLALTLPVVGGTIDLGRSAEDWGRLAVSGVLGLAIADTMIFGALRRLGAGLIAIVESAYAPTVVLCSVLLLGEEVGPTFAAGTGLVVVGVLAATWERRPVGPAPDRRPVERRELLVGLAEGLGGVVLMAVGIVIAKPAFERGGVVEVTLLRLVFGVLGQLVLILPRPSSWSVLGIFRPQPVWRDLVPGAVLGAYLALVLWIGGMKYTDASVAGVLGQLTVVFTLVLARVFLGEPLPPRKLLGGLAATAGAILVVL